MAGIVFGAARPLQTGFDRDREYTSAVHFRQLVVGVVAAGIALGAAGLEGRPADAREIGRAHV